MKITNELFEKMKNTKDICTVLNQDYVVLVKAMPVVDAKLEEYISNLRKAYEKGIQVAPILDYKLIPETTIYYEDLGISYTKGVFLEKRAKGFNNSNTKDFYVEDLNNIDKYIEDYLNSVSNYIDALEKKSLASPDVYDKLVKDLVDFNIIPDPKPLNTFYDLKEGFTFIDLIPLNMEKDKYNDILNNFFPNYIFVSVLGYGLPSLVLNFKSFNVLTEELNLRLQKAYLSIIKKIANSLTKHFSNKDLVKVSLEERLDFINQIKVMNENEMRDFIKNNLEEKENKINEENNNKGISIIA